MDSDSDDSQPFPRVPAYPGEDVRPTSSKELLGWYSYGWASEVFVVCGVGMYPNPMSTTTLLNES
jgi:MFS transporter, UMF1 family